MDFPVTLSTDLSICNVTLPASMVHNQISGSTGVLVPGPAAIDLEAVVNMWWPPGALVGKAKFTDTVKHQNLCIMQDGHDLGLLLLHVQVMPLPDDLFSMALHTLKSSRKAMFSAGEVQANGEPIGCVDFLPPTPMLSCADPIPLPTAFCPTNSFNNVLVGLSGWDLAAGWVAIAVEMARSYIRSRTAGPTSFRDEILGTNDSRRDSAVDSVVSGGNAAGLVRAIGRATGDYHGPASFEVGAQQGMFVEGTVGMEFSDEGEQLAAGANVGPVDTGDQNLVQHNSQGVTWF